MIFSMVFKSGLFAFRERIAPRFGIEPTRVLSEYPISAARLCRYILIPFSAQNDKKIGAGLFGGEGFIMQKLSGDGLAFLEIDGSVMEYELAIGESMLINTGYLAAMSESCKLKVETVAGLKNKFFGGEGFFNTAVSGPGHVWIQTMPANKMAGALRPYIPNGD